MAEAYGVVPDDKLDLIRIDSPDHLVAWVPGRDEERLANARLLAAAPLMLTALTELTLAAGEADALHDAGLVVPAKVWEALYQANVLARAAMEQARS